jgi:hypothetical protein
MNELNRKFIEDFRDRVRDYPSYDKVVKDTDERRKHIIGSITECIKFLNDSVLATGTSSLQRTNVELPKEEKNTWDTTTKIITFNHKGIGSMGVKGTASGGYSYGTNFSKELSTDVFLKVISDDTLKTGIVDDLINNKSMKLLKRFNDVCRVEKELKELNSLSDKYNESKISYTFEEPQEVFKPIMIADDSNNNSVKLVRLIVEKISMIRSDTFSVHIKKGEDDEAIDDDAAYNRYGNRDK